MRRFFIDNLQASAGSSVTIGGDEARHMLTVLRMGTGDRLILINGSGTELTAEITSVEDGEVKLTVIGEMPCAAEPIHKVTLFQCLPKAGKMELIIQKCVELGIHAIQPVYSKRCVVKPERSDNKTVRYNRVSHEAAKQCGRAAAPEVFPVMTLSSCDFSAFDLVLVAYEEEEELTLKTVLSDFKEIRATGETGIAIVIGPEGGFEQEEVDFVMRNGKNAHSVSLGKRILRTETAGMAMLAMLMYDLEG
ncbi:MAG: 16S rRNA (uracil(1498)-N(3))-methyltransferase [Clostridia bacterium]|nr:16S rRNA (uracil(1498)-N(3))-methyltransferase [Clostridia bacterium]